MKNASITTTRLHLSPTTIEDAALFLELLNTPKWLKFIGDRNVKTLAAAETYIEERVRPQFEKIGYGNYTLSLKNDGTKIGCCGLYDREGVDGVDIGFSLLPAFEKMVYGYEAAVCVRDVGFTQFNLSKIGAITVPENKSSIGLLKKLGLVYIKTITLENDPQELRYYEIENPSISSPS